MQDADLAVVVLGPVFLGPVVDRAGRGHVVTESQQAIVFAFAFNSIGRLDNESDAHASVGSDDQSLTNAWDSVYGITHDCQPILGRVHDFEDGLLGLAKSSFGEFRASPNDLNCLL